MENLYDWDDDAAYLDDAAREQRAEQIYGDLFESGPCRWRAYSKMSENIGQRVIDAVFDDVVGFVKALYWLDSQYRYPDKATEARLYLSRLARTVIDGIVSEEVDAQVQREIDEYEPDVER